MDAWQDAPWLGKLHRQRLLDCTLPMGVRQPSLFDRHFSTARGR
jgi:hypothetical protein